MVAGDSKPRLQAPNQKTDFRSRDSAVHVGFIENQQKLVAGIARQPVAGLAEDGAFNRAQQHILEHRVVGDEQIRGILLDLMAGEQLTIAGLRV